MLDSAPAPPRRGRPARVGQAVDQGTDWVGRELEVGFEDPGGPAGLAVHRPAQPHQPAPVSACGVGDVRPAELIDAEALDDPLVRALDRADPSGRGPVVVLGCREWLVEQPVGVRGPASALEQQMAGALGEERPQMMQLSGLVDVDPQRPVCATACLSPRGCQRTAGAMNSSSPRFACVAASASRASSQRMCPVPPAGRKWSARARVCIWSVPSLRVPAASSTSPSGWREAPARAGDCRRAGARSHRPRVARVRRPRASFEGGTRASRAFCFARMWRAPKGTDALVFLDDQDQLRTH
jgi:hypothetical protein